MRIGACTTAVRTRSTRGFELTDLRMTSTFWGTLTAACVLSLSFGACNTVLDNRPGTLAETDDDGHAPAADASGAPDGSPAVARADDATAPPLECNAGYADCNASAGDGCETDLSSPTTCGACDAKCPDVADATSTCTAGVCGFVCDDDFRLCDGSCTARSNSKACGPACTACPVPAHSTATCVDDTCAFRCDDDFGDCDAKAANGCERSLASDLLACGKCGRVCVPFLQACAKGVCRRRH